MSLAQLHYTSAPPGPDGSGFRFTAVTPGLPTSLLREAEPLIGYEPPRDAPPRPTDEQLDGFPRMFSHTLLSDGSRLLSRTVYTGADYSGRWGNFHAHAVHLPVGARLPGDQLPITAWESARWAVRTPEGAEPAPLTALPPSGHFDREGLVAFAGSRAPWLAAFFADLRRSAESADAPQIVLVERDSADVARWIALASTALPRNDAHQLTFTTYTRRPQLAGQQIIGVLPDDSRGMDGYDHRYRLYDCTGRSSTEPVSDLWAETAAQIWLGGAPHLFKEAAGLPGAPFDAGPLAAAALCAGVVLGPACRTAAIGWACEHHGVLAGDRLPRLIAALCSPVDDRTAEESAALARFCTVLDGRAPAAATAPLAALVLTEAVRTSSLELPRLSPSAFTAEHRGRLAAELATDLRDGIANGASDAIRALQLLAVADPLGVDCADLVPDLARRLSAALLADPAQADAPAVRSALDGHFGLRVALFGKLDDLAAGDPPAAARLLARAGLVVPDTQSLPHLRMCALMARAAADEDRVTALHHLVNGAGVPLFTEPLVLRTAMRLVWDGGTPTTGQAALLLGETGSDVHRAAGTWPTLVQAALDAPADDPHAPDLARDLLRCFPEELDPRVRGALLLLEFAGDLTHGPAGQGWAARAASLRAVAEPVEPAVLTRAFDAVARRLLDTERPDGELSALAACRDEELLAAYGREARTDRVRDLLRTDPMYAADCFTCWSSHPGTDPVWDATRNGLLDEVLRPVVRALPQEGVASVETALERAQGRWAEEFRQWNRPGALSRFARRLGGRGRRSAPPGPRWNDVQPPRKDGGPS
ncbi:GTPase-associated protein 1-related protein [Streptomyces rimosus]|uniref:GTPase-associated protein 1-related protein n=1 Tax=Streptomyces rimosus TaxID=1927 RepID=UPI0005191804|nr:GTPase-associated protein 1-related protein [Streptomyces rimosus]